MSGSYSTLENLDAYPLKLVIEWVSLFDSFFLIQSNDFMHGILAF